MPGEQGEAKTITVTVRTDDGFVEKPIDPLQISHFWDTYYETRVFLDNGDIWIIKETMKEIRWKIKEWERQ